MTNTSMQAKKYRKYGSQMTPKYEKTKRTETLKP